MQAFIEKIKQTPLFSINKACPPQDIADHLILLQTLEFSPPPLEYLKFIQEINGVRTFNACIYGCYKKSDTNLIDFLDKNLLLDREDKKYIITLGENTMDYLVYNKNENQYETRDLSSDQVTYTFETLKDALSYFLDI